MEKRTVQGSREWMGVPVDYGLYSDKPVDGTDRERLRQARLQKAYLEHKRAICLEYQQLFYEGMNLAIPDEAQWDFILYLAGHPVEMTCRFQTYPLLLENLRELYKRITSDG